MPARIRTGVLIWGISMGSFVVQAMGETERAVVKPEEIWEMSAEERELPHLLNIDTHINYIDPAWELLWTESGGVGSFLPVTSSLKVLSLRSGQHVRITGTFIPSKGLVADQIHVDVLAENEAVEVLPTDGHIGEIKRLDRHMVVAEGLVDSVTINDEEHIRLSLVIENQPVICWVHPDDIHALPNWTGKFIRVVALYSGRVDPTGTQNSIELWTARQSQVRVVGALENDPRFSAPATLIGNLSAKSTGATVLVRGRVQQQEFGRQVIIRDESGEIALDSVQRQRLQTGERIEAFGRAESNGSSWTIKSAIYRIPQATVGPSAAQAEGDLRTVDQIRELSLQEAARGRPVKISGVVVWSNPDTDYFFLQDHTGGIRLRYEHRTSSPPLIGKNLAVEGVTYNSGFAPAVDIRHITELGALVPPLAKEVTLEWIKSGAQDGQWVEMRGFLTRVDSQGDERQLHVATPDGVFTAHLKSSVNLAANVGALLRLRGAVDTVPEENQPVSEVKLRVPYLNDITMEENAPVDLFQLPSHHLSTLDQLSELQRLTRVHVSGVLQHQVPGRYLIIREGDTALLMFGSDRKTFSPGDVVDAVGVLGREGVRTVLREVVCQKTAAGAAPKAEPLRDPSRFALSLDGRLVQLRGTLLEVLPGPATTRLTLLNGNTVFDAMLDVAPETALPRDVVPGCGLELTGIYHVQFDDSRRSLGFQMFLRTPADIVVVEHPRLWTVQRALMVSGLLGGGTVAGLLWAWMLRRQVRRQTDQIRRQLEKEIVLEDCHRSIIENASDFIFTTDIQGRFTSFNAAGERMTGFDRHQAMGMNIRDLLLPTGSDSEDVAAFIPSGEGTVTHQFQLRTHDGQVIWIETNSRLLCEAGRPTGVLGVGRDISGRKEVEAQMERARNAAEANTRAKSEFLANMSHELRTPMNAVIGMSNLLLETPLNDEQRDFSETIRNGAESLLTILNDILDFSKIEAGHLRFETLDFELREIVESTADLLAPRAAAKELEFLTFVPPDLPNHLRGDPGRLRQVLINLIGNAIKFTDSGEISVCVEDRSQEPDKVELYFAVKDTGIGLTVEEIERLFRPFAQADSSTTRRFGGTGLGLAISKQIVECMGGRYGVDSAPGRGSTFWFTAKFPRPINQPAPDISRNGLVGKHVAIVDDNATVRDILRRYVEAWGMVAKAAANCPELLAGAKGGRLPDVVLLDANLPGPEFDTTASPEEMAATLGHVQIVRMATLGKPNQAVSEPSTKPHRTLSKPIRQEELIRLLFDLFHPDQQTVVEPPPIAEPVTTARVDSLRVLVAEDNAVNQRVAQRQLQSLGCKTHVVANGMEVLEEINRSDFDVILMDCQMPEMDGYEASRLIRSHSRHDCLWIVALTANAMQGDREKCLQAGMDAYLAKPIKMKELLAILEQCKGARIQMARPPSSVLSYPAIRSA